MELYELALKITIFFVPFLFALCFHEFAHGWMAQKRGDDTAKMMGRLNLNPHSHADVIGTYVLPLAAIILNWGMFFGWGKPVPVNERNLKNPKVDMFWIALAGPLSNILLALIGAFVLVAFNYYGNQVKLAPYIIEFFKFFIQINAVLAVFNLIPVHPLDGGKVIARFLSPNANRWMEENQMVLSMILMVAILTGMMPFIGYFAKFMYGFFISIAQMVII
tara:strand:- start:51450 stop:52109 length:660 start_codon:yes stop_codon:yes gene_type:complete